MGFFRNFGQLPRTWLILGVMVVAGLCEGFGIVLFVPVLELMDEGGQSSWIMKGTEQFFMLIRMPVSMPAMLVLMALLMVGAFALNFLQARLLVVAYFRRVSDLRAEIFNNTFRANWGFLSGCAHGETIPLKIR